MKGALAAPFSLLTPPLNSRIRHANLVPERNSCRANMRASRGQIVEMARERQEKITLSVIPDTDIALFHWNGPITLEDREYCRRKMVEYCLAQGLTKIIVDGRDQISKTDIVDSFEFGRDVPSEMRGLKIAVVHRADDTSLKFIETVAYNRGGTTAPFLTMQEAQEWLESLD